MYVNSHEQNNLLHLLGVFFVVVVVVFVFVFCFLLLFFSVSLSLECWNVKSILQKIFSKRISFQSLNVRDNTMMKTVRYKMMTKREDWDAVSS